MSIAEQLNKLNQTIADAKHLARKHRNNAWNRTYYTNLVKTLSRERDELCNQALEKHLSC